MMKSSTHGFKTLTAQVHREEQAKTTRTKTIGFR